MKEPIRNFLVGIFVVASLGALGVLMVWFGETPTWLRTSDWELHIRGVQNLRGVGEGTPVKLNGVEIGRVEGVDFTNRERPEHGVIIIARIRREYSIPTGGFARVYGATLGIGSGLINVIVDEGAGVALLPKEGASIRGEMSSMLNEIVTPEMKVTFEETVANIGKFADAATPVARNLELLLEQRNILDVDEGGTMSNITTIIQRIDDLVANLNAVLGDEATQDNVKGAVRDVRDASESLKALVTRLHERIDQIADNADRAIVNTESDIQSAMQEIDKLLRSITEAATSLAQIMSDVQRGRGTAGLLATDERLYESALIAIRRFNEVLDNLAIITARIRDDGYIRFNLDTPAGAIPAGKFKTPGGARGDRQRTGASLQSTER